MIVGIDLGTTNSAVAIWRDGRAELVPNAIGDVLTPSAVSVTEKGEVLVGMAARERHVTHPEDSAMAFKRYMGTQQTVRLAGRNYSAEDLSALVLASLKRDVEAATGETVEAAIITVPAYFNDRQRKATKRAGQLAGLTVRRLINEPTAAALAYSIHERDEKEPFLVFDLGGGTFDVSIVEVFDGIVEVRASAGDNRLGGEDFNDAVVALVRPRIDPDGALDAADPVKIDALLDAAAERTRRALSETSEAPFAVTWDGRAFETVITEAEFEAQTKALIDRLRDPLLRSLRDSNIRVEELSEIVPVGGSTRMPVIRKAVTRMFGRFPNTSVHPDQAVALGAGVQAGLAARDADLDEIRLTDVCPFTLGVEESYYDRQGQIRSGVFSPIIDRNTPVPCSRVKAYSTMQDGQRQIQFNIFQGESREVANNVRLGEIVVPVPSGQAGQVYAECRFTYDINGLLEVDVSVPQAGTDHNLVIVDDEHAMDEAEIADRRAALAALKVHPRDEAENAAVIARAERLYESLLGPDRDGLGRTIAQFHEVLESQEPRAIDEARKTVVAQLDAIEGERFL